MENEPQCQHHLDGDVGVDRLAAPTGSTRRSPSGQRCLVQPEGQITPPPQASFVGRPVRDPTPCLRNTMTARGVVLERHLAPLSAPLPTRRPPIYAPTPLSVPIPSQRGT